MKPFKFKYFTIQQENSALKVGTDAMILGSIVHAINPKNCLDIGCGTGVIALMLAQKFEKASIIAIEPDKQSLVDCKINILNSSWNQRLSLIETTIQEYKTDLKFDLIVSNPPFYEDSLLSNDEVQNKAKHASQGLLNDFFQNARQLLSELGFFWIILPTENKTKWIDFAESIGLFLQTEWLIAAKPDVIKRTVLSFSIHKNETPKQQTLLLRNSDNSYSAEYIELTKEFHFNKL